MRTKGDRADEAAARRDSSRKGPIRAIRTILEADRLLYEVWKPILLYGIAVELLVGVAFVPFFLWVLAEVLTIARSDVVLNYDLESLAFSLDGLLLGLLWALIFCTLTIVVLGGAVILTAAAHAGRTVTMRTVVRRVLASLSRVLSVGLIKLTLFLFVLAPLIAAVATALGALLLAPFGAGPVEHWIPNEVHEIAWVAPAAFVLVCLAYVFFVRWSLTIHCVVLDRLPLRKAIRRSVALVRGSFWRVARVILLHQLTSGLFLGLVSVALGVIDWVLSGMVPAENGALFGYLVALLVVLDSVVIGLAAVLITGRGIALVTILYYRLQGDSVDLDLQTDELAPGPRAKARRLAGAGLLLLAIASGTALTLPEVNEELAELDSAVAVAAHRGSSLKAPENTLSAIRFAIEDGAHFVEFDVQPAKDGALVLVHDETLKRTTGVDRKVSELTLPELKQLDAGSWFDERFKEERIPTLDEVLTLAKGKIQLVVELKAYERQEGFARAVVEAIHGAEFQDDCVIQSTDYQILQEVRTLDPDLTIGIIVAASVGRLGRLDVDFYSVQPKYASVGFIRKAHESGRDVYVWTVNKESAMTRFIDRGIDTLITDRPRPALGILDARSEADELYAALARLFRR
ncbi:MAG: glycerophosphodiester phosphodiesterase family protein [Planctomycetota bacterium]|jgi:glycerophosphoryl diester phosphodiesterase